MTMDTKKVLLDAYKTLNDVPLSCGLRNSNVAMAMISIANYLGEVLAEEALADIKLPDPSLGAA